MEHETELKYTLVFLGFVKRKFFLAIFFYVLVNILALFFSSCNQQNKIEKIKSLTILHLSGTPYERGLAHGQLLREEINITISKWKKVVEETSNNTFDEVISDFFDNTTYVEIIKKTCPELLEEVYGISEGSGIDYETILAFQMSEEIDALSDELNNKHCTAIGMNRTDTEPTFLAQNMDPDQFLHGFPTLLHIIDKESKLESYVYTFPGFIGLDGLNSNGIAITCNSMSMLNYSKHGLPVAFIVRSVLTQKHEQNAFDFIKEVPMGIPQCFIIGGISGIRCFECSANQKTEYFTFKDKNIALHTNYAITNRDFNQKYIHVLSEYGKTIDDPYYCPRLYLAYDKIKEVNYKLNYENIKSILSLAEPAIQPISNENTYGCLIMELSKYPKLFLAPGRPDKTEFIEFSLN